MMGVKSKLKIKNAIFISEDSRVNKYETNEYQEFLFHSNGRIHKSYDIIEGKSKNQIKNIYFQMNKPAWCQRDETPLDDNKKPFRFIASIEIEELFNGVYYLFYDEKSKTVVQVFQMT